MFSLYRLLTVGLPLLMVSVLHYLSPSLYVSSPPSTADNLHHNADPNDRHWCMLTRDLVPKNDKWFATIEHFPHTLEWFAHCWNWVQSENNDQGASVKGGFIVDEYVYKKLQKKYWNRAFFPAMEWPVEVISNNASSTTTMEYDKISTDYYHGSGWFQRADGVCDSFRQRMWHNFGVQVVDDEHHKRSRKQKKIGIVNRNESRAIADVEKLVQQLHSRYKHSDIDVRTIESEYSLTRKQDTLEAQAKWFADKDLVIMIW